MNLEIIVSLSLALFCSFTAMGFMIWYIRKILSRLLFVSENVGDLVDMIEAYSEHLKSVHGLEQFYGDESLRTLISHTNSLLEMLEEYEDIYSLSMPIEEDEQIEKLIEQEDGELSETQQKKEQNGENVFYAGARTGNN